MRRHRLTRPNRAHLAGRVVADGDNEVHLRRIGFGEYVPRLARRPSVGRRRDLRSSNAFGWISPFGCDPAEYALKRPLPNSRSRDSAMMLRAEFPVHRNSTLYGLSHRHAQQAFVWSGLFRFFAGPQHCVALFPHALTSAGSFARRRKPERCRAYGRLPTRFPADRSSSACCRAHSSS